MRVSIKKLVTNVACWLLIAYMLSIALSSYSSIFVFDFSFLSYNILILAGIILTIYYCIEDLGIRSLKAKLEKITKEREVLAIMTILLIFLSFNSVCAELQNSNVFSANFPLKNDMGNETLGNCIISGKTISCPIKSGETLRIVVLLKMICSMDYGSCIVANYTAGEFMYKWAETGDENYLNIALNVLSTKYLDLMRENLASMYYKFTLPFVVLILAFFLAYFWRLLRGEPP